MSWQDLMCCRHASWFDACRQDPHSLSLHDLTCRRQASLNGRNESCLSFSSRRRSCSFERRRGGMRASEHPRVPLGRLAPHHTWRPRPCGPSGFFLFVSLRHFEVSHFGFTVARAAAWRARQHQCLPDTARCPSSWQLRPRRRRRHLQRLTEGGPIHGGTRCRL